MKHVDGRLRVGILALAVLVVSTEACNRAEGDASRRADRTSTSSRSESAGAPATSTSSEQPAAPEPGKAWVIFGSDTVDAEVARTPDERAKGLMYREKVPAGTGMLFVFDQEAPQSFWMANTYVALDIAFMDASYTVVDIQQMEPLTTDSHQSGAPALFALEVPKGWFAAHGVHVGSVAEVKFGAQLPG
jgi:hypothetical protein